MYINDSPRPLSTKESQNQFSPNLEFYEAESHTILSKRLGGTASLSLTTDERSIDTNSLTLLEDSLYDDGSSLFSPKQMWDTANMRSPLPLRPSTGTDTGRKKSPSRLKSGPSTAPAIENVARYFHEGKNVSPTRPPDTQTRIPAILNPLERNGRGVEERQQEADIEKLALQEIKKQLRNNHRAFTTRY